VAPFVGTSWTAKVRTLADACIRACMLSFLCSPALAHDRSESHRSLARLPVPGLDRLRKLSHPTSEASRRRRVRVTLVVGDLLHKGYSGGVPSFQLLIASGAELAPAMLQVDSKIHASRSCCTPGLAVLRPVVALYQEGVAIVTAILPS